MATPILSTQDDHLLAEKCVDLPLVDFGLITEGNEAEIEKLVTAARNWGFIQLVNHGVSRDLLGEIEEQACHAFALPIEAKDRAAESRDPGVFLGYVSCSQGMNVGCKHSNEAFRFPLNPQRRGDLITKFWPDGNEPFSSTVDHYIAAVEPICLQVLKSLASGIGLDPLYFTQDVSNVGHGSVLRMNFYPIIGKSQSDLSPTLGLVAHTDVQLLTILYQNGVDGLQILKNNSWIAVHGRPDSFTVNVGDLLQVLSNDVYKSVMHRVVTSRNVSRLSILLGISLHPKTIVRPAPELVNAQQPYAYRPFTADDYFANSLTHRAKGNIPLEMFRESAVGVI